MSIEAMKQALEALEECIGYKTSPFMTRDCESAITALRAAIEQMQDKHEDWCASLTQLLLSMPPKPAPCNCKLKTIRRDSRQWQGLTDEELREAYLAIRGNEWCLGGMSNAESFYEAIEAKLKEKNT